MPDIRLLHFKFIILTILSTINTTLLFTLVVHDFGVELSIRAARINSKIIILDWSIFNRLIKLIFPIMLWQFSVGDVFKTQQPAVPWYFSSGATLPQKNTLVQNNHLWFSTITSKKMVHNITVWITQNVSVPLWNPTWGWRHPLAYQSYIPRATP